MCKGVYNQIIKCYQNNITVDNNIFLAYENCTCNHMTIHGCEIAAYTCLGRPYMQSLQSVMLHDPKKYGDITS